jgi:hypothetical protein
MDHFVELIIPLAFFASVFGIIYVYFQARNKERLALIEKGADASIFFSQEGKKGNKHVLLKIGLFLIGIAVGVVAGYLLSMTGMNEQAGYISMIFLFGGLGLIVYYPINKRME